MAKINPTTVALGAGVGIGLTSLAFILRQKAEPVPAPAQLPPAAPAAPPEPSSTTAAAAPPEPSPPAAQATAAQTKAPQAPKESPPAASQRQAPTVPYPAPSAPPQTQASPSLGQQVGQTLESLAPLALALLPAVLTINRNHRRRRIPPPSSSAGTSAKGSYPVRPGEPDPNALPTVPQETTGYLSGYWLGFNQPFNARLVLGRPWQASNFGPSVNGKPAQPSPQLYWHRVGMEDGIDRLPPRVDINTRIDPSNDGSARESYIGGRSFAELNYDGALKESQMLGFDLTGDSTVWWYREGEYDAVQRQPEKTIFLWPPPAHQWNGKLVQAFNSPAIYLIQNSLKRHILSPATVVAYGGTQNLYTVDQMTIDRFVQGADLP